MGAPQNEDLPLTPKQERFALEMAQHRDVERAYRAAYDVSPDTKKQTVLNEGSKLAVNARIRLRIADHERSIACAAEWSVEQALKAWLDIAFADPRDLIGLRVGACRHCWGVGGGYHWTPAEYARALAAAEAKQQPLPDIGGGIDYNRTRDPNPNCDECQGEGVERVVPRDTSKLSPQAARLYGGVKKKRDGLEIIIADQTKALENASRIIGAFKDNVRLSGSIAGMIAAVELRDKDPAEAARLYQQVIQGIAA